VSAYDCIVLGGGIVGLSTAWQLQERQRGKRILLLEKEREPARHQTGRNSGVIHAGIYYEPGSLKARFCREGLGATLRFCRENGIAAEQCGKLLVATSPAEEERMDALFERARLNGLDVERLDADELREREPAVTGTGAIFLRNTGIVDYREVASALARRFEAAGGEIRLGEQATGLEESAEGLLVRTASGARFRTRFLVACCGLQADRVARLMGIDAGVRIVPFRGEYFRLSSRFDDTFRHLVYPIPDPELPFLGVHITRMIGGGVTVGPNAVLGWKREGYGRVNVGARDAWEVLSYPGAWRLVSANLARGLVELRNSLWTRGFLAEVRKYCPGIEAQDLRPHPAGVRAQAVLPDGTMVHDFLFAETGRSLHVLNAPSPAATSALPIGRHVCERVARMTDGLS
jgi:L-2-hydroxyglutarate oxidase